MIEAIIARQYFSQEVCVMLAGFSCFLIAGFSVVAFFGAFFFIALFATFLITFWILLGIACADGSG